MIDWPSVKTAYAASQKSCAQLGREFGVSASLVARHCREEKWERAREHGSTETPEHKYALLLEASQRLDERILQLLSRPEQVDSKEVNELSRAIKTALDIKAQLAEKTEGPTQLTIRFEHPEWAE